MKITLNELRKIVKKELKSVIIEQENHKLNDNFFRKNLYCFLINNRKIEHYISNNFYLNQLYSFYLENVNYFFNNPLFE